ncbi:unnamed protein product [Calypogeia fissa]
MSEIFDGYERQYCELSTNLSRKCTSLGLVNGEERKQKLTELKTVVDEAESLIRRMDLEARSLPFHPKAALLVKLREYKSDLTDLKRAIKKASAGGDALASRDDLMEGGITNSALSSVDQRGRLAMSTERLNQSGDKIKDSKRTLLETEDLGVSILQDLHQQRQVLLHSREMLHGVDDTIGKSKRILNSMTRRMSKHKWIMVTIIFVLSVAIIVVLFIKFS